MDEKTAREILKDYIRDDNKLRLNYPFFCEWPSLASGKTRIRLDGEFSIYQMEAIVWWMKNKGE